MKHTNHPDNGDTGAYFFFDEKAFTEMVGNADWPGKAWEIKQTGKHDWTGSVMVWKCPYSHGRRNSGSKKEQWAANDKITLGSCGRFTE